MKYPLSMAYVLTPITFGGSEKVSLNFLSNVDRNQIHLHVIALVRPWEKPPLLLEEIERLDISYQTLPVALRPGFDPMRLFRLTWSLFRILRQQQFDLLHAHGYLADICALPIARLLRIPTISTCHGYIKIDWKVHIYNHMDWWVLRFCSRVITVSDEIRKDLVHHGIDDRKIRVVTNAVSVPPLTTQKSNDRDGFRSQYGISPEEFVYIFSGRLSEEKGLNYLIEAFAELIKSTTNARLVLIGEGPQRKSIEQQIVELGLEKRVILTGFQKQVLPWLFAGDCFVLPSLTEGTPMALLEAMAAGNPIVASSVGGVPGVITDGVNGLLVPSADKESLRNSLYRVYNDPELREQCGSEARKTIESRYSIQPWCQKILQIYQDVI